MEINLKIVPTKIGERQYYTIAQLAAIVNKSEQTIYGLCKNGNAVRKMKYEKIGNMIFIPTEELSDFPFTYAGKHGKESVYHYDRYGRLIDAEE